MLGKKKHISKDGWNWEAFFKNFYWYGKKGMVGSSVLMIVAILVTLGLGLIPVMIYCGAKGNKDFYNHVKKNSFIL